MSADGMLRAFHYRTGRPVEVIWRGGRITSVTEAKLDDSNVRIETVAADTASIEEALWIAPGLVDLQVNGFASWDFNQPPLSPHSVRSLIEALWTRGVTEVYPTVTTNSPDAIERAMRAIVQARADPNIALSIPGIHLEGPFLSPRDGPRGAHDRRWIQPPDWDLFQRWQEAADGLIRLITLSPEWNEAERFIRRVVRTGVQVAIGHTAANTDQIRRAVDAGATLSTHLGNGAHLMLPRHPNYIWDQLAEERLWASIIGDGFHLPDSVIRVILKVKPTMTFLISDAVSLAGFPPGRYRTSIGGEVVLTSEGKLHLLDEPGLLAGSAMSLDQMVVRMTERGLLPFADAWELASLRPAAYAGLETAAGLTVEAPANMVIFTQSCEKGVVVEKVFLRGELVYSRIHHEVSN